MPRMNGRELAGLLTTLYPTIEVVFMSGYTDTTTARDEAAAVRSFLPKPFTSEALVKTVREALGRSS
jgi:FixJ family two-component response regulator